jgi:hypothetical protein
MASLRGNRIKASRVGIVQVRLLRKLAMTNDITHRSLLPSSGNGVRRQVAVELAVVVP